LASGVVLSLDQAAPANQALLRHLGECGQVAIWIAIAVYVLVAIIRKRLDLDFSLHSMLQILSVTPFEKVPLFQLLTEMAPAEPSARNPNQLILL
jgi:hypothetical protein